MGKVQSANRKKEELDLKGLRNWIYITIAWIAFVFVLYGTSSHYFPEPIPIGFGFYGSVSDAIIFTGFALWTAITSYKLVFALKKSRK